MFGLGNAESGSAESGKVRWHPTLTPRWLKDAAFAHRLAFEREMQRDRRGLERRYKAYLKKENARHD
jgi:hypothetical protein